MADITLGIGDQTYQYVRNGTPLNDTILDFKSIYYSAFLSEEFAVPPTGLSETASISFRLIFSRDRLEISATSGNVDFDGTRTGGTTADDVTGFQIHEGALGVNGDTVFGLVGPNSDLNGDLVITGTTAFSAWDAAEGENGNTLLALLSALDAGTLYADIQLDGSLTSSIRGQIIKQDIGNDLIDVSGINIGEYSTLLSLLLSYPGASLSTDAVIETYLDGVAYTLSLTDATIGGLHPDNFVYQTAVVDDTFNGGANRDDFFGGAGNDTLNGGGDIDRLFGESGDDILDGGAGADIMFGGTGNDTFYVDNVGDVVNESSGVDTIISTIDLALPVNVENLVLVGALTGIGNNLNNVITGNSGNNFLNGVGGADTMIGGAGNDTYHFDIVGDTAIEEVGGGIDLVRTLVSINAQNPLPANIENVQLNGVGNFLVVGNELNNVMNGNSGINQLRGMGGNDVLFGFDGNDVIIGGAGRDQMAGGNGNDTFHFDSLAELGNTPSTRDYITDFVAGSDRLDFNTMDANSVLAGNQDFTWVGTGAFTGAGQLRYVQSAGGPGTADDRTFVYGNLDNNLSTIEFQIELKGLITLGAGDIVA